MRSVVNSTISGNEAIYGSGGGLEGNMTIANSTISGNIASINDGGGGIYSDGDVYLANTIVAGNLGTDIAGETVNAGSSHNLIGTGGSGGLTNGVNGNLVGVPSLLLGLGGVADNGGPTQTVALLPSSPAINAGDNALIPTDPSTGLPFTTDQTGASRIFDNGTVDIGAFEFQGTPVASTVFNTASDAGRLPDGVNSLRDAIGWAEIEGAPTVTFDPTVFSTPQTIDLTQGELVVAGTPGGLTIDGPGPNLLTIDAEGYSRVFSVYGNTTISGVTITGGDGIGFNYGHNSPYGGGVFDFGSLTITNSVISGNSSAHGGGIENYGTLTVDNSSISGNSTHPTPYNFSSGGGIGNGGTLTVDNSTISGNSTLGSGSTGGGIFNLRLGTVTVANSTISGNTADRSGGGIQSGLQSNGGSGPVTVTNSTISGNTAGLDGGGIYNFLSDLTVIGTTVSGNSAEDWGGGIDNPLERDANSLLTVVNSTISGNQANYGGGLEGEMTVANSTISGNQANYGGGIMGEMTVANSTISGNKSKNDGGGIWINSFGNDYLANTIVAGNTDQSGDANDIGGGQGIVFATGTYNLIGTGGSGGVTNGVNGNQVGVANPGLGALADNGGPTLTMALLPGSPAIEAGDITQIPIDPSTGLPLTTDQRGFARIVNGTVDIGAFEDQVVVTTPVNVQAATAGSVATVNLGSFADSAIDPGNSTVVVDFGDGSPTMTVLNVAPGSLGSVTHTFAANGTYTVTVTATDQFSDANLGSLVVVVPATPTVSVNPVNITYGTALSNTQLSGTASWTVGGNPVTVTGTFTYTTAAGIVLGVGTGQTEAVTFTPGDSTDYTTASTTVIVNVAQATPTVSVNPVNITYGTALSNSQLTGTATWTVEGNPVTVAGTFAYTTAVGTVLGGGTGQSEAVTFTPSDSTDYTTASTTVTVNVAQAGTTTALASSMNPTVYGQAVTFTATVASAVLSVGPPTGSVTFFAGATSLGSAPLSDGVASLAVTTLTVGSDSITAVYSGDPNFAGSPSTALSQTVEQDGTTAAVVSSANPSVFGQSVTFTATVSPTAPGGGTPTGTVIFMDGSTVLGSPILSGGVATYTTSSLPVSNDKVKVVYGGDSNFTGSVSSIVTQTVTKDTTTTSVTSSANPSAFGQSVTFTATVAAAAPGSGTPTGTVTFKDGSTILGHTALTSGSASFTTASLAVAIHSIAMSYSGDANFTTSASTPLSQVVNQGGTTTSLVSATDPSMFGQAVTLTATVSAAAPGSGTPAGKVTFYDGSTSLGTASLSAGSARFTAKALPTSADSITASYVGSGHFTPSTSAVLVQTVNQATTTSAVTSSINPSVYGQSVTFTAIVTAVAPGSGTPTGSITFLDGSTTLGTVTLNGRKATFKTTALAIGPQTITVSYSGDGNFLSSTSGPLTQTVNQAATTSRVTSSANPSVFGESVTFTATVKAVAPGSGTPTGSVAFLDGSTALGTETLSGGTATLSISTLAALAHPITVVYGGDTNFSTSTSGILAQTVKQAATTSSVSSSANPSVSDQAVTFTATIAPLSPGAGTPTGSVTFDDGSTVLGTVTLTNGTAGFTTSSLAGGTHSIKAVYAGDANFKVSTSAVLKQVVRSPSNAVVEVTIAPSLVDEALSALGDETVTDALVSDLAGLQTSVTRAKGAAAAARA